MPLVPRRTTLGLAAQRFGSPGPWFRSRLVGMLDDDRIPSAEVLQALPIFPLPNAVLLPGMMLPLNVFEPRYLALVDHVLARTRMIGVPLLRPGYESEYEGRPAIESVFGVGRMVSHHRLPDGRRFIRLEGLRRVRAVRELAPRAPFRELEAELLPEERPSDAHQLEVLKAQLERISVTLRPEDQQIIESILGIPDSRTLIYAVAAIVPTLSMMPEPLVAGRSAFLDLQQQCLDAETADGRVAYLLEAAASVCGRLQDSGRFPRMVLN